MTPLRTVPPKTHRILENYFFSKVLNTANSAGIFALFVSSLFDGNKFKNLRKWLSELTIVFDKGKIGTISLLSIYLLNYTTS